MYFNEMKWVCPIEKNLEFQIPVHRVLNRKILLIQSFLYFIFGYKVSINEKLCTLWILTNVMEVFTNPSDQYVDHLTVCCRNG